MTPSDLLAGAFLVLAVVLIVGVVGLYFFAVALALAARLDERTHRQVRARPHRVRILRHSVELFMPPNVKGTAAPSWTWWGR
jgi:site-specific recombinase